MQVQKSYINHLSIDHGGKGIPYGGMEQPREDGTQNFGFKNVKGSPQDVSLIPEAAEDAALRNLLEMLAEPEIGLISVGCGRYEVQTDGMHQVTGYVEFSYNSRSHITDAATYFPLFFHFDRNLHKSGFATPVMFVWELMGATFINQKADGFTCTIYVKSQLEPTRELAAAAWDAGLTVLTSHLSTVEPFSDPLY